MENDHKECQHEWKWVALPEKQFGENMFGKMVNCYAGTAECTKCKFSTWRRIDNEEYEKIYFGVLGTPI